MGGERGNERTADADCRGGQFDVAWDQGPLAHHNACPLKLVPGESQFPNLSRVDLAAEPGALLRIWRLGKRTAILAGRLDLGLRLDPVRSRGSVIDAESESQQKARA